MGSRARGSIWNWASRRCSQKRSVSGGVKRLCGFPGESEGVMSRSLTFSGSALLLGFCLGLIGCARPPSEVPAAAPVSVPVSYPAERYVTDYADFTGRTAAVDSVE